MKKEESMGEARALGSGQGALGSSQEADRLGEEPDFVLSREANEITNTALDPSRQVETEFLEEPDFVRGREASEITKSASEPNRQVETEVLEEFKAHRSGAEFMGAGSALPLQGSKDPFREGYGAYAPGVTVERDEESPTGYRVTFIYAQQKAYPGLTGRVKRVRLYSDCMNLFDPGQGRGASWQEYLYGQEEIPALPTAFSPEEYRDGLFPGGGEQAVLFVEMENFQEGLWAAQICLPSGAFVYNFELTDEKGQVISRLDDPSNPTLWNQATGHHSLSSLVYVPYDERQGRGEFQGRFYGNRSIELPRRNRKGKVETLSYVSASGEERGLAVYLPYGYSENRAQPYPVLYLSHGGSKDDLGNELRWMHEGDVPNILDQLVAIGRARPFVVVTMDNQRIDGESWSYEHIWREQERIFDVIKEHYHVRTDQEGQAYAGLSMGGITSSNMLFYHPDRFGYIGIWSGANDQIESLEPLLSQKDNLHLMFGGGLWDYGMSSVWDLQKKLEEAGLTGECVIVPGAHDWESWKKLFSYAAENFFFKEQENSQEDREQDFDYSSFQKGYTVYPDEASPTGYFGVFVYEEQPSYEGLKGRVAKVYFFSNTLLLFSYDSMGEETCLDPRFSYTPEEYRPGLYPAGGDTAPQICQGQKVNYYKAMTRFAPGLWGVRIPVFSGAYDYNFQVFDEEGNESIGCNGYLYDPNNPPLQNATGDVDRSSMFYVPYQASTMGVGKWVDRSIFIPCQGERVGRLRFDTYESENGIRDLGIYLPYGYDPNRREPYRVLYLSHGQQSEMDGTEMRWMAECGVVNIMDQLQGDFLVVTMNNKNLGWEESLIWDELLNMIAYMEQHYHVGPTPRDRAMAGFSMGGFTTQRVYLAHPEAFAYFGIWSFGKASLLQSLSPERLRVLCEAPCQVQIGIGDWDYLYHGELGAAELYEELRSIGIKADFRVVPASHDWCCWQMLFAGAVQDFFWK